jgi:hypothetical protein
LGDLFYRQCVGADPCENDKRLAIQKVVRHKRSCTSLVRAIWRRAGFLGAVPYVTALLPLKRASHDLLGGPEATSDICEAQYMEEPEASRSQNSPHRMIPYQASMTQGPGRLEGPSSSDMVHESRCGRSRERGTSSRWHHKSSQAHHQMARGFRRDVDSQKCRDFDNSYLYRHMS